MARLFDCFCPLFSFGLELDAAIAAGRMGRTPDGVQRRALYLLEEARVTARAAGIPAQRIESASFAMVAWLDEIVARNPGWSTGVTPLQVQLFNSNNAHSEFFHHLSALQADDGAVREIYWHALVHGFKGQYYFENGDSGELGKLKELHGQQLPVQPLAPGTLAVERITPQPYSVPDPPGPRIPERRERALLRAAGALALLIPLVYLLGSMLNGPREAPPTLAQRVEQQLQTYACADLAATAGADGATRVSGFVSLPEDMARVEREVRAMPGVSAASFQLQLRVWPHCEVVAILKPYQARNRDKRYGLKVAALSAQNGRLREGDLVLVQATNADYDGYLWVDYFTADGAVMHLNAGRGQARLRAGESVELGRDIPSSWLVSPPFGTVLVTALSSPVPFNETADRPPFELASPYLQRLRESLAANEAGGRPIADFVFLETVSR
ncbi:type IV / VI secretion system protein, DotU family [Variovorax sp. CF079]|uniref:DotU family type IV/VI secretion system protein n=1 Tax=Variovorax sp. CF079 TaxID=1882774 RepID=UPI00087E0BC6|nr:DotU family type IV/VI secretion system protein [Variovorax sp. CF079]SDE66103.1 type IV / VI secretion system protein, DotU family [Variovorax sp. CF079]